MTDSDALLPAPMSFVRDNMAWLLGLVPFLIAAFQILKVSLGDPTVTAYLISNLDILKFGLAIILPCLPIAGFWVCIAWLQTRSRLPEPQKSQLEWTVFTVQLAIWPFIFSMTVITFVTNVVVTYGFFVAWRWLHDRKQRKSGAYDPENRLQMRPIILGLAFALNSIVSSSTISWLPLEIISVERQANVTARVLSTDGDWTTYLDNDRRIYITATPKIQLRVACSPTSSISSKPLALALVSIFKRDANPNRTCPPT
jgi:hypothetical protein